MFVQVGERKLQGQAAVEGGNGAARTDTGSVQLPWLSETPFTLALDAAVYPVVSTLRKL